MTQNMTLGEDLLKAIYNVSKHGGCLSVAFYTFSQSKGKVKVFGKLGKEYGTIQAFIDDWVNGPPV
jgi:hypothetical protein